MQSNSRDDILGFFKSISNNYDFDYIPHPSSKNLIVAFSYTRKLALTNYKFSENVLYVSEFRQNYYITQMPRLVTALVALEHLFEGIVFMGLSKGGFGALAAAATCAARRPQRHWRALAFSPIASLLPGAGGDHFPSVVTLRKRAAQSHGLRFRYEQFGEILPLVRGRANLTATVVYGVKSPVDAAAALSLSAPNVRLYPLHFSLHSTLFAFLARDRAAQVNLDRLRRMYASPDPDLKSTAVDGLEEVARDIEGMSWLPDLNGLIAECLSLGRDRRARQADLTDGSRLRLLRGPPEAPC